MGSCHQFFSSQGVVICDEFDYCGVGGGFEVEVRDVQCDYCDVVVVCFIVCGWVWVDVVEGVGVVFVVD